jgi:hypothetical protein
VISEERMIEKMKKRKTKIVGLCIIIVMSCVILVIGGIVIEKGLDRIKDSDYWTEAVVNTQNVPEAWAQLFSSCAMLAFGTSKIYVMIMVMACVLGVMGVQLFAEFTGLGRQRLIVSMWERLERLEKAEQEEGEENV